MREALHKAAWLFLIFCTISFHAFAERPKIKYGDISSKDFAPASYPVDPTANAVVLAHFGEAFYEGNTQGNLSVVYKKHLRIRIMNRNGFDAGTISIGLYQGSIAGSEEKLDKIDAATFNLVNDKVEVTKLESKNIFKDKVTKRLHVLKFTMPNLQEGSIIDIKYSVISPFPTQLDPWSFQGQYPVLYSEYQLSTPELYEFVVLGQGYHPFAEKSQKTSAQQYNIVDPGNSASSSNVFRYNANVNTSTWAMENVPALKEERFTTTLENHISKLSFQIKRINMPNGGASTAIINNWMKVANDLMKDPDFGEELAGGLGWLKSEVKTIVGNANGLDAAKAIHQYVRTNFTCSNHSGIYKTNSLRKIFQNKSGNVADINLLLTAMLLAQGFDAYPVLLSTRNHGVTYDSYPIMERFNYVITKLVVDEKSYVLDGSYSKLGFGQLPHACYNGNGRIISNQPYILNLSADSITETKIYNYFLVADGPGTLSGTHSTRLGSFGSYETRQQLDKTPEKEYFEKLKKGYSNDIKVYDLEFEALADCNQPLAINYKLSMKWDEDIVYLNPLFAHGQTDNPFKAAERTYPVEMPYAFNEVIVARIDIPKGYEVDEVPKSRRVMFNEDEGMFEYIFSKDNKMIQVRSTLKMNKANFLPDDYATLRDFFGYVVKSHSEQIVFKKIKK